MTGSVAKWAARAAARRSSNPGIAFSRRSTKDMPNPSQSPDTVGGVVLYVLAHPWQTFVERWNWKAALLSAMFRGIAFALPMSHLTGSDAAPGMWIEIGFRIAIGGFWGSLLQAFRTARPAWLAGLSMVVLLPV